RRPRRDHAGRERLAGRGRRHRRDGRPAARVRGRPRDRSPHGCGRPRARGRVLGAADGAGAGRALLAAVLERKGALRHALPVALVLASLYTAADAVAASPKQLIEFGWDEPNPRFMREHIAELQASPFDGCVFHADYATDSGDSGSFTWNLWGHRRFESGQLAAALADLK